MYVAYSTYRDATGWLINPLIRTADQTTAGYAYTRIYVCTEPSMDVPLPMYVPNVFHDIRYLLYIC